MDKKQKSWGETMKMTGRALGIFYTRYPQMVISRLICVAWTALTPYVGIYLSAALIDELAGRRNTDRLRFLVVLLLLSQAGIALVRLDGLRSGGRSESLPAEPVADLAAAGAKR